MKKKLMSLALALTLALSTVPGAFAAETANPTNDKLTVDGVEQTPTVYKIGGSNYFKIRDVAAVLNGTEKQFSVGYSNGKVTVTSGQPYEATGKELAGAPSESRTASRSSDSIIIDGTEASLTVYKIGGSNYFKLRDLGKALDFQVDWAAGQGVMIETGGTAAPVEPDQPTEATLANGKPVTEENVLAIMAEIEREYPTGTPWAERTVAGTAYNPNKVSAAFNVIIHGQYGVNTTYACGGFAAMVSDRVFGYDAPCRKVDDVTEIRPGDIIVHLDKNGNATHVSIAMSGVLNEYNYVARCEGNNNSQVKWPTDDGLNTARPTAAKPWAIYTRYPEG